MWSSSLGPLQGSDHYPETGWWFPDHHPHRICPGKRRGNPHVTIIPERDVYRLIMRSKLPAAEAFEEWVVGEGNNMAHTTGSSLTPIVHVKDGQVFANSRDVAEFFGKEHKHVLRDIRDIRGMSRFGHTPSGWFVERQDVNPQNGQLYPSVDMTRDGFTLLVMGYTGANLRWFIQADYRDNASRFGVVHRAAGR